ncbi:MAG TPA: Na+/H+ antiporter NhaC family protein [Symbiobacteriaceae bacterium]|nr:Na+/H+ antiporter NhaC family protein [Symbiobacteriaceae bacterium]
MNPVLLSVLAVLLLSLLKVNVVVALLVAALVGGLTSGMTLPDTMKTLIGGMGGNAETALSYLLLGALAVAIAETGITDLLVRSAVTRLQKARTAALLMGIALLSSLSQNLIPVHIAFIPLLIPPLLPVFDRLQIDRRGVASALTFGLQAPYMLIPAGFGLIFHNIVADNMTKSGMAIAVTELPKAMLIPTLGMVAGLLWAAFVTYRKPQQRTDAPGAAATVLTPMAGASRWEWRHTASVLAVLATLLVQLKTDSLVLGGLTGLGLLSVTGALPWRRFDGAVLDGIKMMGFMGFVMLVAAGYADVVKASGGVESLVTSVASLIGGNRLLGVVLMLLVGLTVDMGIGTSFGTVPIIATVFVPLCATLGFSPLATAAIIGTAAALGDAGSPASDSTLGPTAGLAADGKHDHIWDTCVPTFLHYNIPLVLFGMVAAMVL